MQLSEILDKVTTLSPISLAIALVAVLATIAYFALASKGLPPGPTGIPYLGYWPFLDSKAVHHQLDSMKKKYGDVFSFWSSGTLYINLGSSKAIREAHLTKGDCFGSRITDYSLLSHSFEDGVAFANGEPWKVLRKFFLVLLRERGATSIKDSMSGSMYDSMNDTVNYLRSKNGKPENIIQLLTDKCNAILRTTLFGEIGVTQEQVREINESYAIITDCMTPTNLLLTGNFAKFYFNTMPSIRNGLRSLRRVENCIYKIIDEHKSSYNEDHMRDIIDEYIRERNLRKSKGDPTAKHFTDKALMASLVQFMGDGVLAVAVFTTLFILNAVDHPEEQEKIYKEIVEVVGQDRQPTMDDKSKLTYTNAFIQEVLRTSDFFPIFPSQECIKETTIHGYRIPVGAITLMNSYSAHYDPLVHEEPQKFNPSRYVSKEGAKRAELPLTFGVGKRSCLGEGFVMAQVFLFLATLIKNFRLTKTKESDNVFSDLLLGKVEICTHPRGQK